MKAAVLYYSKSGNTKAMAQVIADGMMKVEGVDVKTFSIDDIDIDWINESKCIVLGSPTYLASVAGAVKTWLDTGSGKCSMAGKLGGAFATANYIHGGGDLAIRLILDHLLVKGMLTYSGGGSAGKPVIHLGPVAIGENLHDYDETFSIYGERMAAKAMELFRI